MFYLRQEEKQLCQLCSMTNNAQLLIDGNITTDKQEVAEALNNFFVEVGMNAVRNIRDGQSFFDCMHPAMDEN